MVGAGPASVTAAGIVASTNYARGAVPVAVIAQEVPLIAAAARARACSKHDGDSLFWEFWTVCQLPKERIQLFIAVPQSQM